jgi:tol-pal system protein YbgF
LGPPRSAFGASPQGATPAARRSRFRGVRLVSVVVCVTNRLKRVAAPSIGRRIAVTGLFFVATLAQAGLFDDDEARRAILDLRSRTAQVDEQAKARAAELAVAQSQMAERLNEQLNEQVGQLKRSLLDLSNQLEAMRVELAKLRGNDEQLARDLAELQRRQKDVAQATDERLRKIEPQKVAVDGKEFTADPEENRGYDEAIATLRAGDFDKAVAALGNFLRRYPVSGYADSARFWLGNAQYGRRDYKDAVLSFRAFVAAAPEHPRAPEALLALANSQAEMKDPRAARKTIEELLKSYPASEAAQAGKERLSSLK